MTQKNQKNFLGISKKSRPSDSIKESIDNNDNSISSRNFCADFSNIATRLEQSEYTKEFSGRENNNNDNLVLENRLFTGDSDIDATKFEKASNKLE